MNVILPRKIPKAPKRSTRWRSQAHEKHVKSFACCWCGSADDVEGAHVRFGSHTGLGQTPDDFLMVPLCAVCHRTGARSQHMVGEETFWRRYHNVKGHTVWRLLAELERTSPKRQEIERVKRERSGM